MINKNRFCKNISSQCKILTKLDIFEIKVNEFRIKKNVQNETNFLIIENHKKLHETRYLNSIILKSIHL